MTNDADTPPLSRPRRVDEIEYGAEGEIAITKSEMAAIATLLDLKTLGDLAFAYRIRPGGGGRLHLSGRLKARVTQTCIVSLDPVETGRHTGRGGVLAGFADRGARTKRRRPRRRVRLARTHCRWQDRFRPADLREPGHGARPISQAGGGQLRMVARDGTGP
jgi:hypothetical protein